MRDDIAFISAINDAVQLSQGEDYNMPVRRIDKG